MNCTLVSKYAFPLVAIGFLSSPTSGLAEPTIRTMPCVNDASRTCATGIDGLVIEDQTYNVDFVISTHDTAFCSGNGIFFSDSVRFWENVAAQAAANAIATVLNNNGVSGPIGTAVGNYILVPAGEYSYDAEPLTLWSNLAYTVGGPWLFESNLFIGATRSFDLKNSWQGSVAWAVIRPLGIDADCVAEATDQCPNTVFPETAPTNGQLGAGRYALTTADPATFTQGAGTKKTYTLEDTAGCTCDQIVAALGLGEGHKKFGCSKSVMDAWVMGLPGK